MFAELAARLPDAPRWVETRGMLLSGRCALVGERGPGPADFIVRGEDFGLFVVAGEASVAPLPAALERHGGKAVLCVPENGDRVAASLRSWTRSRAVIHRLGSPQAPPASARLDAPGARVGMLSSREAGALAHVPDALREEIATALGFAHVAASFVDEKPVSFCSVVYETETHWDVSIDTLEAYRGRGLAGASCRFLIDHMSRHGKEPVWGALTQNTPSMKMAAALGFEPVDELVVFKRGEPR